MAKNKQQTNNALFFTNDINVLAKMHDYFDAILQNSNVLFKDSIYFKVYNSAWNTEIYILFNVTLNNYYYQIPLMQFSFFVDKETRNEIIKNKDIKEDKEEKIENSIDVLDDEIEEAVLQDELDQSLENTFGVDLKNQKSSDPNEFIFHISHRLNCNIKDKDDLRGINVNELLTSFKNSLFDLFENNINETNHLLKLFVSFVFYYKELKTNEKFSLIDTNQLTLFDSTSGISLLKDELKDEPKDKENIQTNKQFYYSILLNNHFFYQNNNHFSPTLIENFGVPQSEVGLFFNSFNVIYLIGLLNKSILNNDKNNLEDFNDLDFINPKLDLLLNNDVFIKYEYCDDLYFLNLNHYYRLLHKHKLKHPKNKTVLWTKKDDLNFNFMDAYVLWEDLLFRQCKYALTYLNLIVYKQEKDETDPSSYNELIDNLSMRHTLSNNYMLLNSLLYSDPQTAYYKVDEKNPLFNIKAKCKIKLDLIFNSISSYLEFDLDYLKNVSDNTIAFLKEHHIVLNENETNKTPIFWSPDQHLYLASKKYLVSKLNLQELKINKTKNKDGNYPYYLYDFSINQYNQLATALSTITSNIINKIAKYLKLHEEVFVLIKELEKTTDKDKQETILNTFIDNVNKINEIDVNNNNLINSYDKDNLVIKDLKQIINTKSDKIKSNVAQIIEDQWE